MFLMYCLSLLCCPPAEPFISLWHGKPPDPPLHPPRTGSLRLGTLPVPSYLKGRIYRVTYRRSVSEPCSVTTGEPLGSVLGVILFYLYSKLLGSLIPSHGFSYLSYADDKQLILSFPWSWKPRWLTSLSGCWHTTWSSIWTRLSCSFFQGRHLPSTTSPLTWRTLWCLRLGLQGTWVGHCLTSCPLQPILLW